MPRPLHPLPGALLAHSGGGLPKWMEPVSKPLRHVGRRLAQLRKSRAGMIIYGLAALFGLLQFVFVLELLGPSKYGAPDKPGDNLMSKSLGNEKVEVRDLWQKYFAHTDAVPWPDFAAHLLIHDSWEMQPLPNEMRESVGKLFDLNNDGKVTAKEFQRCLLKHGELGVVREIDKVVNATLKNARHKQQERLRPHSSKGCALALHGGFHNYVEVQHSEDMSFNGKAEFCAEMWVSPNVTSEAPGIAEATGVAALVPSPSVSLGHTERYAQWGAAANAQTHKTYGGTLLSKYNRGRMGQFFVAIEHGGDVFFHRETPPWGLRSHGVKIPPGVFTHLAVCYGSDRTKMFVNGTLRGSQVEEGVATDDTTPILIGSIYDQGAASGGFHGLIDELRIWSVDRSQMEIQSTMHVSLTGAEFGLEAYWSFDECAGHSVRDKMGRHDGIAHGGLWHESPVELYDASNLALAQASSQQQLDDLVVKGERVNFDYWKRSVSILEDQIRINKLLLKRKHEYAELIKRVKLLEKSETKCGEMVTDMNERNLNVAASVEELQHNLTTHERATGVYGDAEGTSLDLDTLQIDDGVSLAAWLAAVSTTGVDEREAWRSYEHHAEQEEVLDEGVSFAMMDAEGQKEFKERNRAKREVLPAIELAAKAGFEADDNTLSTLQSFNQGTFNKDELSEAEEDEEEYVELLQMKGYGSSRIKALLKKRRAKASSGAKEDEDDMPLTDRLARSDVAGLLQPRSVAKRKPSKKKRSGEKEIALNEEERRFAEFEDMVAEEEAQWEPEPADEEAEEVVDAMDEKSRTVQKKVTPARGRASKRRRDDADEDAEDYGDADGGFGIVNAVEQEGETTKYLNPTKVHDEKRPAAHKRERSKDGQPQPFKSIEQAAEDMLVDTLVAGMVPRVTEMLKLDAEDDRMPSEEEQKAAEESEEEDQEAAREQAQRQARADAEAFGLVSEMPQELKERLEEEERAFATPRGDSGRQRARSMVGSKRGDSSGSRLKLEGAAAPNAKHLVGETAKKKPAEWRTESSATFTVAGSAPDIV